MEEGEWMEYTIQVRESGNYAIYATIASDKEGGRLSVLKDNAVLTTITVPDTKGLQSWQKAGGEKVALSKGMYHFRIYNNTGGYNLKNLVFEKQ
jgi:hypothetical protein